MLINDLFLSFLDIFSLTASNICAILGMIKFDTDRDIMPKYPYKALKILFLYIKLNKNTDNLQIKSQKILDKVFLKEKF